jgi:flagellar basal body P-ring formation protein FlgA
MIRTLARTVFLLLALSGTAAAQSDHPALRERVTVDSDLVRIGDLVENAGAVADVPIFRSPDLGTTGAVSTDEIVAAIGPHQLIDIDTRGLAEVIVTRASRAIGPREIAASIAQTLSQQYALGDPKDISLTFDLPVHTLEVESGATGDLQVRALTYDPRSGRFDVTFDLPTSQVLHRQPARFTGLAIETVAAVAVDRTVERGEVLQASDLIVLRRPKAQAGDLVDMQAAAGQAARHQLRPGQPIYLTDLMKPDIVQRNDTVTLVYEAPGLTLTLRGQAQGAGALGDTIDVLNPQTKRVIQGVISGPGRVNVASTMMHIVETSVETSPEPMQAAAAAPSAQQE